MAPQAGGYKRVDQQVLMPPGKGSKNETSVAGRIIMTIKTGKPEVA